jgi:hypothetical protein
MWQVQTAGKLGRHDFGDFARHGMIFRALSHFREAEMTIRYLTEEEHLERMARAIYLSHVRRVTLITGWDRLSEDRREAFRALARHVVAGADQIREAARLGSASVVRPAANTLAEMNEVPAV